MPPTKSNSKSMGTPGVKMLITAASLAATICGWTLLSANEAQSVTQQPAPPTTPQTTSHAASRGAASTLVINLAPLPTLVPLVLRSQLVTASNTTASRPVVQPAAPVQQVAPAQLTLRVVSAPPQQSARSSTSGPAPVVNTRSSR